MPNLVTLIVQLVIIVGTARLVGPLFRLRSQPQVVGEMAAGILLGPSVFGALLPRTFATVFRVTRRLRCPPCWACWSRFHSFRCWHRPACSFTGFALFMGAALSVTAFPVLARILVEKHLIHTRVGVVALACAAVDDVTAWCMLAAVILVVRAGANEVPLWITVAALSRTAY